MRGFEEAIEEVFPEINFLTFASDQVSPGAVLQSEGDERLYAHLRNYIGEPDDWDPIHDPDISELFPESLSGMAKGGAAIKLLKFFGLEVSGDEEFELQFDVGRMQMVMLDRSKLDDIKISKKLRRLRKKDGRAWRRLLGRYLVTDLLVTNQLSLEFAFRRGVEASVAVSIPDKWEAEGDARYEWTSLGKLTIEREMTFGALGKKIRRFSLGAT